MFGGGVCAEAEEKKAETVSIKGRTNFLIKSAL